MVNFKYLIARFLNVLALAGVVGLMTFGQNSAQAASNQDILDAIDTLQTKLLKKCKLPRSWGGVIAGNKRFIPTFVDSSGVAQAYCDRQTGLVWQAQLDGRPNPDTSRITLDEAREKCLNFTWLDQKGGRLPSVAEMASLLDTSVATCDGSGTGECLPDGHPFRDVSRFYWTSTSSTTTLPANNHWWVRIINGVVQEVQNTGSAAAWCVRGPMNESEY